MTIRIPGDVGWKQTNRSSILGSLWSTFNIDLQSNKGKVRVSPRLKKSLDTQGLPVAFARFGGFIYSIAGTTIYRSDADDTLGIQGATNGTLEADASSSASTDYTAMSDLVAAWDVLFASSPTKLRTLSAFTGGTWTDRITFASTQANHKLLYFPKFDRVYYNDGDFAYIRSITEDYTSSLTGDYTLELLNTYLIDMKATSQHIWIAAQGEGNQYLYGGGRVLQWDGISNSYRTYRVPGTRAVVALVIDPTKDIPYAMGDNGVLYAFNGSGFEEVDRLPFPAGRLPRINGDSTITNNRFIHPNGMIFTKNRTIMALINNRQTRTADLLEENLPSGIWERSETNGFTHRYSFSYDPRTSAITDYGQIAISLPGALAEMEVYFNDVNNPREGTILAGATVFTDASSTNSAIFYDNSLDTVQKYGSLITTEIYSQNVEETWNNVYARHRLLLDSADSITVKYRKTNDTPVESTITWVDTNTFTVTAANVPNLAVGDEVEILQGTGGGKCAHVESFTGTTTLTVNLDDTFTGVTTGTAKARFQKWTKIGSQTDQTAQYLASSIGTPSTYIQFKVCMQFKGKDELNDLLVAHKESIPIS